jgi:hypothetical protein
VLPGLAPKAADLVGGGWREAATEVFMEEQVHSVALDKSLKQFKIKTGKFMRVRTFYYLPPKAGFNWRGPARR